MMCVAAEVSMHTLPAVPIFEMTRLGMVSPMIGAASSYLLHPKLYDLSSRELGRDLMAAVPSRDALVIFGSSSSTKQLLANKVRHDYQQTAHPLSDRLFRLTPDGVVLA